MLDDYSASAAEASPVDADSIRRQAKPLKQMKMKRDPKKLRLAGGQAWEDHTLDDWDQGKGSYQYLCLEV